MYNIEKLRAKRAARLAATRSAAEGNDFEILNTAFLPQGVNLWFPAEQCQMMMRVVQFEVTQKNNIDNNEIGDYVAARSYYLHRLPGQKKSFICPSTYGKPCPVCERFYSFSKEERGNFKGPANAFKPRQMVVFNALCKIASEDGTTKTVMRVVRGGHFSTYGKILEAVKNTATFNPKRADDIFQFEDLELGYWLQVGFAKAASISGAGGTPFMQIVVCNPMWQEQRVAISEKVWAKVTDLDRLIPQAPSIAEINEMLGDGVSDFSKEVEGGGDDLGDDFSDDVKGIAPAAVDPAPAPAPAPAPKDGDDIADDDIQTVTAPPEDDFGDIGAETVPTAAVPVSDFAQSVPAAPKSAPKPVAPKPAPAPTFDADDFDSFDF